MYAVMGVIGWNVVIMLINYLYLIYEYSWTTNLNVSCTTYVWCCKRNMCCTILKLNWIIYYIFDNKLNHALIFKSGITFNPDIFKKNDKMVILLIIWPTYVADVIGNGCIRPNQTAAHVKQQHCLLGQRWRIHESYSKNNSHY